MGKFLSTSDVYQPTGEVLGNGATSVVRTYRNIHNNQEYAVKVSQFLLNMIILR